MRCHHGDCCLDSTSFSLKDLKSYDFKHHRGQDTNLCRIITLLRKNFKNLIFIDYDFYYSLIIWLYGQVVKTSPSHGGIPGSNPGGVTTYKDTRYR